MDLSHAVNRLPELNQAQIDQVRAMMREEIALAFGALSAAASYLDMPYETSELDSRALTNIGQAADRAAQEYEARCETADEERAEAAKNPFAEPKPDTAVDDTTEALRVIRDSLAGSGAHPDHVARLDRLIKRRGNDPATCDHYYLWAREGVAATHCERCGTARPF
jgi:hypothetical protein